MTAPGLLTLRTLTLLSAARYTLSRRSAAATITASFIVIHQPLSTLAQQQEQDGHCSSGASCSTLLTRSASTQSTMPSNIGYLDADAAAQLDEELMSSPGFTLEQLMELAGLSVAEAVYSVLQEQNKKQGKILIVCGPGNNGGDGLVAARHLTMFGYQCTVVYPKQSSKQPHYANLVQQCRDLDITVRESMPDDLTAGKASAYVAIVDAIFGFSFKGEPRPPFDAILQRIIDVQQQDKVLTFAVDVPSGWNVNEGDVSGMGFMPDVLISLTAPKFCARSYTGRHFIGGRFLPPALSAKYKVNVPNYHGVAQIVEVTQVEGSS